MAWPGLASADRAALKLTGVPVRYRPQFDDPINVTGQFWAEFVRAGANESGVAQVGPAVFLLLSDLVRADGTSVDPRTDNPTITVADVDYRMREPVPDYEGGILLHLQRA